MKKRKKKFFICCNNISWKHGCVVCELQCSYTVDQRARWPALQSAVISIFHRAVNRQPQHNQKWLPGEHFAESGLAI